MNQVSDSRAGDRGELGESGRAYVAGSNEMELAMTTDEKTKPVTDLFEQAMKSYEQALRTGVKMQEESAKFFNNLVNQATSPQDWQKRMKAMTDDLIPQTQKSVDEGLKIIEQTSRTSVELLKKSCCDRSADVCAGCPGEVPRPVGGVIERHA